MKCHLSRRMKTVHHTFGNNLTHAFESLTYYLFCHEFQQPYGIFHYFNQPHIETNPIHVGDRYIGFQSKYYADSVTMSSKEQELIGAVKGAVQRYSRYYNALFLYQP